MSKEAISEIISNPTKEDIKDVQTVLQASEENVKHDEESNPRHSGRQVTINEDVVASMEETSFMDKSKDCQSNDEKNKAPINNTHSSSTDDIISIHDTDDDNIVKEDSSRPKCLQCMSEVFECTIWFFKSMTSSIRSKLQNCCSCNRKTVDIKNREFDDDGEYWNGNVMNSDGEEGVISFSFDNKEDTNETKETFKHTDLEVNDHSKVNKGFEDIDIKSNHTDSEHKPINGTHSSNGNEIGHTNSSTSAVCRVSVHHESHENKDISNVASTGVSAGGGNVGHDSVDCGSQSGGNHVGHSSGNHGNHNGNHDVGNSGGNHGGHNGSHDGGHDGGDTVESSDD